MWTKFIGDTVKRLTSLGAKHILSLLWNQEERVKVVKLGHNYFHFIFDNGGEIDRIL